MPNKLPTQKLNMRTLFYNVLLWDSVSKAKLLAAMTHDWCAMGTWLVQNDLLSLIRRKYMNWREREFVAKMERREEEGNEEMTCCGPSAKDLELWPTRSTALGASPVLFLLGLAGYGVNANVCWMRSSSRRKQNELHDEEEESRTPIESNRIEQSSRLDSEIPNRTRIWFELVWSFLKNEHTREIRVKRVKSDHLR